MPFKYRENDPATAEKHASGGGDYDTPFLSHIKLWKPSEGKNRIRILPRTWEDGDGPAHWAFPVYIHYKVGPDNGAFLCPQKMGQGPCPICEERAEYAARGDEEGAKALRPSFAFATWIIDRKNPGDGPQIFRMPAQKIEQEICSVSRDDKGATLKIDHPDAGYDVMFQRSGSLDRTQYTGVQVARTESSLSDDDDEYNDWLDFIEDNPIPETFNFYSYEYIARAFGKISAAGSTPEVEEEEEEEEIETRSRRRRRARTSVDEIDEPEGSSSEESEEEEPVDLREDEDDGMPSRTRRRRTRTA